MNFGNINNITFLSVDPHPSLPPHLHFVSASNAGGKEPWDLPLRRDQKGGFNGKSYIVVR